MATYTQLKNFNTIFGGTEGIVVPVGNTAERAGTPSVATLRYNTDIGLLENYNATGWTSLDSPPTVNNISGTINENTNSTITLSGTNFKPNATVAIEGAAVSNIARTLATTFISSTQLTAASNASAVNYVGGASFDIRVTNPSGLAGVLSPAGTIDRDPVWNTAAGSLGSVLEGNSFSTTVSATDPDGTSVTYSLVSGSLPTGLTLNGSNGTISGTTATVSGDTTSSFTLRATSNSQTADRSFSITVLDSMAVTSSSTSGNNNQYTTVQTNNEIQRQGSGATKTLTITGSGFRTGATVTLGGQACTNVNVVNSTTITCTTPTATFSADQTLTVTVTNGLTSQVANSPSTVVARRFGITNFPCVSGNQLFNAGDTTNNGCITYRIRPNTSVAEFATYVCGSTYDGGGYDMYLCTSCASFNYFNQGNSCGGVGLSMWSPRSQPNWQAAQSVWGWTTGTGNGGTTYVYKPNGGGNYTGAPMRQQSFYGSGYNDWRVVDGGRWWLRNSAFGEPNGDYDGFGNLQMYGQSSYEMGLNDGGAYASGSQYVCSTNAKG
jgi:hypothetical protein